MERRLTVLKALHPIRTKVGGESAGQPGHYSKAGQKLNRVLDAKKQHSVLEVISRYLSKGRNLNCVVYNETVQAAPLRTRLQLFACIGCIADVFAN